MLANQGSEEEDEGMLSDTPSIGSLADFSPEVMMWGLNREEAEQWRDLSTFFKTSKKQIKHSKTIVFIAQSYSYC